MEPRMKVKFWEWFFFCGLIYWPTLGWCISLKKHVLHNFIDWIKGNRVKFIILQSCIILSWFLIYLYFYEINNQD